MSQGSSTSSGGLHLSFSNSDASFGSTSSSDNHITEREEQQRAFNLIMKPGDIKYLPEDSKDPDEVAIKGAGFDKEEKRPDINPTIIVHKADTILLNHFRYAVKWIEKGQWKVSKLNIKGVPTETQTLNDEQFSQKIKTMLVSTKMNPNEISHASVVFTRNSKNWPVIPKSKTSISAPKQVGPALVQTQSHVEKKEEVAHVQPKKRVKQRTDSVIEYHAGTQPDNMFVIPYNYNDKQAHVFGSHYIDTNDIQYGYFDGNNGSESEVLMVAMGIGLVVLLLVCLVCMIVYVCGMVSGIVAMKFYNGKQRKRIETRFINNDIESIQ